MRSRVSACESCCKSGDVSRMQAAQAQDEGTAREMGSIALLVGAWCNQEDQPSGAAMHNLAYPLVGGVSVCGNAHTCMGMAVVREVCLSRFSRTVRRSAVPVS